MSKVVEASLGLNSGSVLPTKDDLIMAHGLHENHLCIGDAAFLGSQIKMN